MDKATSSEPIGSQMSVTCSEQNVEQVELETSGDQIVESEVTLVNSEMVMPSSDPRWRLLQSLGHSLSRNLMLMTEILVQSHCQMRRIECSETWI